MLILLYAIIFVFLSHTYYIFVSFVICSYIHGRLIVCNYEYVPFLINLFNAP
jgi:hypothetical protein